MSNFEQILKLDGIEFIKKLLKFEQQRFDDCFFNIPKSTFEQINIEFGIFPNDNPYPIYFMGDITKPDDKMIFVGINPGYGKVKKPEKEYLRNKGLFDGYCNIFSDYFKPHHKNLLPFFNGIRGFISRYKGINRETIDWDWFQKNIIILEMIPYHSSNTSGLRINDLGLYIKTNFKAMTKIISHLNPKEPVYMTGFPTFRCYFEDQLFNDIISFKQKGLIYQGKINNEYSFIGLPFLNRPKGTYNQIIDDLKRPSKPI